MGFIGRRGVENLRVGRVLDSIRFLDLFVVVDYITSHSPGVL